MSRKMLINASEPEEIRVALVEGSILEEYYVERMSVESCLGNIYKGRVTNVEPSIGAAFVEFGGPRHGFLHVSDVMEPAEIPGPEDAAAEAEGEAEAVEAEADHAGPDYDPDAADGDEVVEMHEGSEEENALDADDENQVDEGDDEETESPDLAYSTSDDEEADVDDDGLDAETDLGATDDDDDDVDDDDDDVDDDDEDDDDQDVDPEDREDEEEEEEDGESRADDRGDAPSARKTSKRRGARSSKKARPSSAPDQDRGEREGSGKKSGRGRSKKASGRATKPHLDKPNGNENRGAREPASSDEATRRKGKSILDYVQKGQEIIVQVTKDGIGTKGPTLTTYLSMPGRYLVLMPGHDRRGVSRKIEDPKERDRLKKVLNTLEVRKGLGFIVRTAGVGQTKRALQKDYTYLTQLWDSIEADGNVNKAPHRLYQETDLVSRTIRDVYRPEMGDIIVDDEDVARRTREFLATVMPRAAPNVKLYNGERPLFTAYGIEDEIGQLFLHRVDLKSGGSLIIEQTEALVAIDVNSGRFREEEDLEETAYKINLEAADAIARQLRLRDLGGVIVLDFIDMKSEKRRRALERAFRAALREDRARTKVARMSMFGTIEMTRQRVRPSLRQSIFKRCPSCRGAGYVATPETLLLNVVRQLKLMLARTNKGLEIYLNHVNAEFLFNEKRDRILELEKGAAKPIQVKVETELRDDEFRIVQMG